MKNYVGLYLLEVWHSVEDEYSKLIAKALISDEVLGNYGI